MEATSSRYSKGIDHLPGSEPARPLDEVPQVTATSNTGPLLSLACASALLFCTSTHHAQAADSPKGCPDLAGTFAVGRTAWVDEFSAITARPQIQSKQFATLQRKDSGYTLIWHMRRQDAIAEARLQSEREPRDYGIWLDMVLRDPALPFVNGADDWFAQMAYHGPVFRKDVPLRIDECKRGWALVYRYRIRGPVDAADTNKGTRDLELWLGRGKDGALVLKRLERQLVVLIGPPVGDVNLPLSSSEHEDKWAAVPPLDLAPLREEELPNGDRPSAHIPKCQITSDLQEAFFVRLRANLPPKVTIENVSTSIYYGKMRSDGTCDPTAFSVTLSVPDDGSVEKIAAWLRTDRFIREIDGHEAITSGDWPKWVKFRMMAAP